MKVKILRKILELVDDEWTRKSNRQLTVQAFQKVEKTRNECDKIHNLIYGADIRMSVRMGRESATNQVALEHFSSSILAKLR